MPARTKMVTAEQFLRMPDDGNRYELVSGEVRMMSPAGGRHGRVAHNLGLLLGNHVRSAKLGTVYAAETGFLIGRDPDTVRAPDVALVSHSRAKQFDDDVGFLPVAPDVAAEVISPSDTFSAVEEKALAWLQAGTGLVLLVDPETRTLHVYRAADDISVLAEQDVFESDVEVPGWRFRVAELFV